MCILTVGVAEVTAVMLDDNSRYTVLEVITISTLVLLLATDTGPEVETIIGDVISEATEDEGVVTTTVELSGMTTSVDVGMGIGVVSSVAVLVTTEEIVSVTEGKTVEFMATGVEEVKISLEVSFTAAVALTFIAADVISPDPTSISSTTTVGEMISTTEVSF